MMRVYQFTLRIRSALGTPLAADTLWGHIAWGIRYRSGESALLDWLNRHDQAEPPLVLSEPFPSGYWPRPCLPPAVRPPAATRDAASHAKRLAKRAWVSHDAWQRCNACLSDQALIARLTLEDPCISTTSTARTRIGVHRLNGGTLHESGGAVFTLDESFYDREQVFDLWCVSPEGLDTVRDWLTNGLVGGYGRDASTGLGSIEVVDWKMASLPRPANVNAAMVLGTFVPRSTDPVEGFIRMGLRCGRLGGDYARMSLPNGGERQKKPVSFIAAGSVLMDDEVPLLRGRMLREVHPSLPNVRFPGIALLLPCFLDPQVPQYLMEINR